MNRSELWTLPPRSAEVDTPVGVPRLSHISALPNGGLTASSLGLTQDTSLALIHFADGQTQQWLMVRLPEDVQSKP